MDQKTSRELAGILSGVRSEENLEDYVERLPETESLSFTDYYNNLDKVKQYKKSDLFRRSGIERTYFYQIMNGKRRPGRDKAILLCLAAGLTLEETQRALKYAGLGVLYPRNRRDAVITFAINKGLNITDTQELLEHFGEHVLD